MVPWKLKGIDKPRGRTRELWTKTRRKTRLMTRKTVELGSVSKIIKMYSRGFAWRGLRGQILRRTARLACLNAHQLATANSAPLYI